MMSELEQTWGFGFLDCRSSKGYTERKKEKIWKKGEVDKRRRNSYYWSFKNIPVNDYVSLSD